MLPSPPFQVGFQTNTQKETNLSELIIHLPLLSHTWRFAQFQEIELAKFFLFHLAIGLISWLVNKSELEMGETGIREILSLTGRLLTRHWSHDRVPPWKNLKVSFSMRLSRSILKAVGTYWRKPPQHIGAKLHGATNMSLEILIEVPPMWVTIRRKSSAYLLVGSWGGMRRLVG